MFIIGLYPDGLKEHSEHCSDIKRLNYQLPLTRLFLCLVHTISLYSFSMHYASTNWMAAS